MHISKGKDMYDGKQVEAFVTIQIGDLRKETKSAKKSKNPNWNEPLQEYYHYLCL
jgi:Ca2+-dependent lipid-binding protein